MVKEIELKFSLLNKAEIETFLKQKAEFIKESNQLDIYYNLPHRNFLQTPERIQEWLRLRKSDKGCSINYKDWGTDGTPVCDEHEENVQNIAEIEKIFKAINIEEIIRVNKNRKTWSYKNYTICIDTVEELGDFIELESIQEDDVNLEKITADLNSLKDELGVQTSGINKKGYPYELLHKKNLI